MAEQVIGFRVDVDTGQGQATVGDLRQQFIEAKKAALEAKEGTEGYAEAIRKLAEKKAAIDKLNQTVRALNPDQLINNFTRLGGAIVGGFTAATSAAALFGAESEDVQKALLKVQAAMGLLQGFQAIQQGIQAMLAMRIAITGVIAQMGVLRVAIAATGIGALVVAVGILAEVTARAARETANLAEEQKRLKENAEKDAKFYGDLRIMGLESELNVARLRGAGLEELHQLELNLISEKIRVYQDIKDKQGSLNDEDFIQYKSLQYKKLELDAKFGASVKERNQKAAEEEREVLEEESKKKLAIEQEFWEAKMSILGYGIKSGNELRKQEVDTLDQLQAETNEVQIAGLTEVVKTKLEITDKDLARQKAYANARIQIEQGVFSLVTNLAMLFGKNTEKMAAFQRKAAMVKIIIEQAEALSIAVKAAIGAAAPAAIAAGVGGPFVIAGYVASAIASTTAIFANIKGLLSKAGGTGGLSLDTGSTSASFSPPGGTPAPIINPESTILNDNTNSGGGETDREAAPAGNVRAYVVETDITEAQRRIVKLETEASFG